MSVCRDKYRLLPVTVVAFATAIASVLRVWYTVYCIPSITHRFERMSLCFIPTNFCFICDTVISNAHKSRHCNCYPDVRFPV
ncbi:hypothetical protein EXN66_Car012674 [Channa argus]|uniref:Uncharacterized protein n=1 Tax=Channa argus TaxID=215402 RepID=A0A6G1Q3M2_CHAAH|nr:hypothetical protein EXN66_Car012674 [Channa argus]